MLDLKEKEPLIGRNYQEMGDINISLSEEGLSADLGDLEKYENFLMESE